MEKLVAETKESVISCLRSLRSEMGNGKGICRTSLPEQERDEADRPGFLLEEMSSWPPR
jgi:hypothetical protein